jgi:tRNA (guanine6-N2)-methyltransferase
MKRPRLTYLAHTQPGFEAIAAGEIEELDGAKLHGTRVVADKNGMVLFEYPGDLHDLLALRTIEDLFVVVATLPETPPTRDGLRVLEGSMARAMTMEPALNLVRQVAPARSGRGRLRFRVVSRQVGHAAYRRVDAQKAVERGVVARGDHRWQLAEDGGVELWLTQLPARSERAGGQLESLVALRLTDERMRHRDYKLEHLPASLRPSAAAALAWLTNPAGDDVFLDPMCGAATILIERAQLGRYRQLLGGDVRPEAVAVARANVGPRYKPIELREWDARDLPIEAGSIDAAAVNLPFGRQVGSAEQNRALYPAFLREMARVLRPGGRLVALTGDRATFTESLRRASKLTRRHTLPVLVLGQPASVYIIDRA